MNMLDTYRQMGIKLTPQRIAVLNYLSGNKTHPSAEEIYRSVSKQCPTMSFATVYNILDALKAVGGVSELTIDPDKKRYDPVTSPHHHLMCTRCKSVIDIHKEFKLELPKSITKGFELTGNHIEFYGICSKCKK